MTKPVPNKKPNGHNTMKRCECGCGGVVRLAPYTSKARGWVKGKPVRFIHGHHRRKKTPEYVKEDRGFKSRCWVWQRAKGPNGYGVKWVAGDRQRLAHRVYYQQHVGPIPKGLHIDHLCAQKDCVNPKHLEPVTCRENLRRGKNTKLDMEQVYEVVMRHLSGESAIQLAEEYGTDPRTVHGLSRGAEAVLTKPQ